jgi:hypothetical protein
MFNFKVTCIVLCSLHEVSCCIPQNTTYITCAAVSLIVHLRLLNKGLHYHNPHPLNCLVSQIFLDTLINLVQPPVGDGPISPPAWDTRAVRVGYNNSQYYRSQASGSRNARNTHLTFICLPLRVIQNRMGNQNILRNRFRVFKATHKIQYANNTNYSSSRSSRSTFNKK